LGFKRPARKSIFHASNWQLTRLKLNSDLTVSKKFLAPKKPEFLAFLRGYRKYEVALIRILPDLRLLFAGLPLHALRVAPLGKNETS